MAPLRVAGLIEFHVFETDPLILLTYCIVEDGSVGGRSAAVRVALLRPWWKIVEVWQEMVL